MGISRSKQHQDKDYTCTREGWRCDRANRDRGNSWFQKLYAQDTGPVIDLFAKHRDFEWLIREIAYGLFLSDRQVPDDIDTQIVVLPAVLIQNVRNPSRWHIQGTRRLKFPKEEVQVIWDCVQCILRFFETPLHKVPSVDEVEPDV